MAFMGIVLVAFIFMAIYMVIVYLINSSACMMLFTRGFSDKAWKAFIPFFNTFNLYYHFGIPYLYIVNVLVGIAAALIGKGDVSELSEELLNIRIFAWDKRDGIYITIE